MCLLAEHSAHPKEGVRASRSSLFPPRAVRHTRDLLSPGLDAKESDSKAGKELAIRFIAGGGGGMEPNHAHVVTTAVGPAVQPLDHSWFLSIC